MEIFPGIPDSSMALGRSSLIWTGAEFHTLGTCCLRDQRRLYIKATNLKKLIHELKM
jgi:hypothetical protein